MKKLLLVTLLFLSINTYAVMDKSTIELAGTIKTFTKDYIILHTQNGNRSYVPRNYYKGKMIKKGKYFRTFVSERDYITMFKKIIKHSMGISKKRKRRKR